MQTIQAQINHARWIALCPKCLAEDGNLTALEVKPGDIFICPQEYPEILAKTLVPNLRVKGAFNSVPDEALRAEARQTALAAGAGYEIIFPADKAQIEAALRKRPAAARNWLPDTTLAELQEENQTRGLK